MDLSHIRWHGHASMELEAKGKKIFVDPFNLEAIDAKADVVFITHQHFDHFSIPDIKKIATENTHFVAPRDVASELEGKLFKNVIAAEPGTSANVLGIRYSVVPAYNTYQEKQGFHPKEKDWNGYIIESDSGKVYHAGDTDLIEEMKNIETDVALLPIGGKYTMDLEDAIKACSYVKAKTFVPMHYKAVLGKEKSIGVEKAFAERVSNSAMLKDLNEYFEFS